MAEDIDLLAPGWTELVDRGFGVTTAHYPDGTIRIRHRCKTIDGQRLFAAPALMLGRGHEITQVDPLTVQPSILCPDCGLHGWITKGGWDRHGYRG